MTNTNLQPQHRGKAVPTGWEGILAADEHILWQGRPDQGFYMDFMKLPVALFGLVFAGFALFWMVMASQTGGIFWMFGLIHFSVGIGLTFSAIAWGTVKRRGTWYTLTDKRAFVATDLPFRSRKLDSYAIGPNTRLSLQGGNPGSVIFAQEERRADRRIYSVDVGFDRIADAPHVYELLREIQASARQAERP